MGDDCSICHKTHSDGSDCSAAPEQKRSDSDLIHMLIVRVDELNKRVAYLELFSCKRCGRHKQPFQVYCGAACSARAEYERFQDG